MPRKQNKFCGDIMEIIEDPYTNIEYFNSLSEVQDKETGDTVLHCLARLDENRANKKMMTFFTKQIMNRDISESEKYSLMNRRNRNSETPLHTAITYFGTKSGFVKTLLDANIDTGIVDKFNRTALHKASFFGDSVIVNLLLKYGANPNELNNDGDTPLHFALQSNNDASVKVVRILLKDPRTNVDARNRRGDTPMHIFANTRNSLATLAALMRSKPDLTMRDKSGLTFMDKIRRNRRDEYINWFQQKRDVRKRRR